MERSSRELAVLLFAAAFPSVITWIYFVSLAEAPASLQQGAYSIGKLLQFLLPVGWVVLVAHERLTIWPLTWKGSSIGIIFGIGVLTAALVVYHGWLKPLGFFDMTIAAAHRKIIGMGLNSTSKYVALGVFYSLVHSALEEYYWRWFVFGRLRRVIQLPSAIALSSAGFMAHHVIVLAVFFGWESPVTYLFSLAVGIGGAFWAWLYERSSSLIGPWLSHAIVDAAIFAIGYDLVKDILA